MQTFIYTYILEKLKTEKFTISVDQRYEQFLASLPTPIEVGKMRTLKGETYDTLRKVLWKYTGSPLLRLMQEYPDELGLDPEIFDLVYNGFWDLYTYRPKCTDVTARKLVQWIQKININVNPVKDSAVPIQLEQPSQEAPEDGAPAQNTQPSGPQVDLNIEDTFEPVSAIVRVKIPKQPKEPELDDEGNEIPDNTPESELEDIPFEDKCLSMVTKNEEHQVWVVNHLASKALRQELSQEFRQQIERLDNVDG